MPHAKRSFAKGVPNPEIGNQRLDSRSSTLRLVPEKRLLLSILVLAALIRFTALSSYPNGLFRDEAAKGYTTWSLIETGRDLSGRTWPLQIKEFNAYTSPFYHWFSIPFISGIGLTVFSTRLVAALAGTLACWAIFLCGRSMFGKEAGLWAALLLALSPWHLLFSRWANQGILMTLFIPLALWLTWRCVERNGGKDRFPWKWAIPACVAWAVAWNCYAPGRLFVPLLLLAILIIEAFNREDRKRHVISVVAVGVGTLVLITPFLANLLLNWEETQTRMARVIGDSPFDPLVFLRSYLLHWSPEFLFVEGDANPRHHITGFGQLTIAESLACFLGIVAVATARSRVSCWLLMWLLLAPVPAALTNEGLPHALRTLMIIPAFALLGGWGIGCFANRLPARSALWGRTTILTLVAVQGVVTLYFFFFAYPRESGVHWDAGFLEAVELVEDHRSAEETCLVSGQIAFPWAAVAFVTKPDPQTIQEGKEIPGYAFEETRKSINPMAYPDVDYFIVRPGEMGRIPEWWNQIGLKEPDKPPYWDVYRSSGVRSNN